jgi:hypothetical protein
MNIDYSAMQAEWQKCAIIYLLKLITSARMSAHRCALQAEWAECAIVY